MLEKDKVEKGQDMYSPDLYDGNYAKCKTPSSISAADMYCYCSQRLHKSSFPYVKILVPAIFFLKTRWPSKNLTRANRSNFYPDSFPVARNLVIDRWNSELAYWISAPFLSPQIYWILKFKLATTNSARLVPERPTSTVSAYSAKGLWATEFLHRNF